MFGKTPVEDDGGSSIAANWRNSGTKYARLCNFYSFKVLQMNYITEADLNNTFGEFVAENGM